MRKTAILKFGGVALGEYLTLSTNLQKIRDTVLKYKDSYHNIVIVVSAMLGETRRLKKIADSMFQQPDLQVTDYILAKGEHFSSSILELYFNHSNMKAKALIDDELPIITDDNFGESNIIQVDTKIIKDHLNKDNIVIIPGFIGRTTFGQTTTLGFDGSDTSAIASALYLKADKCILFKDVCGVFTADPHRVKKARRIEQISYNNMFLLSLLGAGIIHVKAVQIAMKNNLEIQVLSNSNEDCGTLVTNEDNLGGITGVTYFEYEDKIAIVIIGNDVQWTKDHLLALLDDYNIKVSYVKNTVHPKNNVTLLLENATNLNDALRIVHSFCKLDRKC